MGRRDLVAAQPAPVQHAWDVLWGISHDNNHFANSLWLYLALPWGDNATWLRLPSILAGALPSPSCRASAARSGAAASLAAAALTALSFFQLTYSVEARGYAGATLALMVGFAALEKAIDAPLGKARFALAAAAGLGLFCHLAVGPAMILYGLIAFGETARRERSLPRARSRRFASSGRSGWPWRRRRSASSPASLVTGRFTIGALRPYAASHAIAAMTNMAMTTLGLFPDWVRQRPSPCSPSPFSSSARS